MDRHFVSVSLDSKADSNKWRSIYSANEVRQYLHGKTNGNSVNISLTATLSVRGMYANVIV
jgi:hypothetical protein